MDTWSEFDRELNEWDKNYIYLVLPIRIGEDSVSVEEFLEHRWARLLTHDDLGEFTAAFQRWVLEGQPL